MILICCKQKGHNSLVNERIVMVSILTKVLSQAIHIQRWLKLIHPSSRFSTKTILTQAKSDQKPQLRVNNQIKDPIQDLVKTMSMKIVENHPFKVKSSQASGTKFTSNRTHIVALACKYVSSSIYSPAKIKPHTTYTCSLKNAFFQRTDAGLHRYAVATGTDSP